MAISILLAFIFLACSFFSLWIKRDPKIWGTLVCFSLFFAVVAGNITILGLGFILSLFALWILYLNKSNIWLFSIIVSLSICFKLKFIPGFYPYFVTPKLAFSLEKSLIGLFPLALIVSLSKNLCDWKDAFKGLGWGIIGIGLLAVAAIASGTTHSDLTIPAHMALRPLSNLVLTSIPEEGFFRGFMQKELCDYFMNIKFGKVVALLLTSTVFAITHIFWSPNLAILAFTFLASILYGIVYLLSGKIESAILCHFLLNLIHMTFFSYHAS